METKQQWERRLKHTSWEAGGIKVLKSKQQIVGDDIETPQM